ncbi:MAG: hypothetical protein EDM03_03120 [Porphyrobacter sp. IPPAS B-1204]|nr:MAG: hypothetical protein EDM03_03120 [Porphyrobacter sp. IPPAS B-1204]
MPALIAVLAAAVSVSAAAREPTAPHTPTDDSATLVRAIAGGPDARRPLARLRNPLCLMVAAPDEAFGRIVAERITVNAKAAGVPLRRAGCTPNALVTFSQNAAEQIALRREEGHRFFRGMSEKEIDAELSGRDPAYVFQAVEATPRWGEGDAVLNDGPMVYWTKERSYLRTPQDLVTTLVVIDNGATGDATPTQLADYATLRLLAQTGEIAADGPQASGTILSLFAVPAAAPAQMTRADQAYLRSLYTLPRTAFAEEVLAAAEADASRGGG